MKKIFLALIAVAATSFSSFADTTLSQAYTALSKLSGMTEQTSKSLPIDGTSSICNVKSSTVVTAPCDAQKYRDSFTYMTENLPVRQMVLGVNNMNDMAFIYATPAGAGKYNVLMIMGDTDGSTFTTVYGQTTKAGVDAIRNSQVSLDAQALSVVTSPADGSQPFVSMAD